MGKQELEILEEQLQRLQKSILERERNIADMESNPLILKYEGDKAVLAKEKEKYELKKKEYYQCCDHPLWYYMGRDILCKGDRIVISLNVRMKCLKCGKEYVVSHKDMMYHRLLVSLIDDYDIMKGKMLYRVFEKFVIHPITTSYETVKQEFQDLEKNGIIDVKIAQILYDKYTIGNFSEEVLDDLLNNPILVNLPLFQFDDKEQTYPSYELLSEEYRELYHKLKYEGYLDRDAIEVLETYKKEKDEDLARNLKIKYKPNRGE